MSDAKAGLAWELARPEWLQLSAGPAAGMRMAFYAYAAGRPWANVLVSHGHGEHSGWWQHVALFFQARGVSAFLFDHFHHGASEGRRGDVPGYDVLAAGVRCALEQGVLPRAHAAPVFVLGHSNGACATLLALPSIAPSLAGLVFSSPLIRLPWAVHWLPAFPAWIAARFDPGAYWHSPALPEHLTAAKQLWPLYSSDPLRIHKTSVRFYLAMRSATKAVSALTDTQGLPLLLLSAGDERVVSAGAMRHWYARLATADKTHLEHPGHRHELFNAPDWARIAGEVVSWMQARVPSRQV
ncbi:MAG: serine aminopeptidase domain-containing protein [SAR324 cluster bacterium]